MVRRFALALATSALATSAALSFVATAALGASLQPAPLKTIAIVVAHAR
jgi:hypothetical protein